MAIVNFTYSLGAENIDIETHANVLMALQDYAINDVNAFGVNYNVRRWTQIRMDCRSQASRP
jgi:hypothetical protein